MTTDDQSDAAVDRQVAALMTGCEFGDLHLEAAMCERLRARLGEALAARRPLRVYAGYDPSAPDLHLGHSITLRKLRQFQRLGHEVTVVVGTTTAMIGDTSDRLTGRPRKSAAEVQEAAHTYADQVATILDASRTAVVANGDWLAEMRLPEVLDLASQFTVQQFLARDNYKRRLNQGEPIGLHEFFYALLQGYDAVHLRADVQLGATEQLFNILAGAKLQEAFGQSPCIALTFPILVGLDGVERMAKSRGNYVGLTEPPEEQFGKVMSISDETMLQWAGLVTDWSANEIDAFRQAVGGGELGPMDAKKRLAHHVVEMYHGANAAARAMQHFERVHQLGHEPQQIPHVVVAQPVALIDLLVEVGAAPSKSAARRLISGGGVSIDGERVSSTDRLVVGPAVVKVGPRRFYRVVPA
jgi:tyrosyl-tRNA synthetase